MAEFQVALVSPERELWSGSARMVLARTLEGELGILPDHAPLLGALVEGGVVTVRRGEDEDIMAAVHGGFLSVHDNRVSILAETAELGSEVDIERARRELEESAQEEDEQARVAAARAKARLTAAGQDQ